jgi:hypothetical protein
MPGNVTTIRRTEAEFAITPLLPLALLMILLGVGVLIALVAPSRVTTGTYQVVVGEQQDEFTIPTESLTCSRAGRVSTCTTPPVAGVPIRTEVTYRDPPDILRSTCEARHGDRTLACQSAIGDYGHTSHSVHILERIDVSDAELTLLRDAVPWWRSPDRLQFVGLLLAGLLALLAGAVGYFVGGRARPRARHRQGLFTIGTAGLGMALFSIGPLIIAPRAGSLLYLATPWAVIAVAVLAGWQYQLCSAERGFRLRYAIGGFLATASYSFVAFFVFLLASGFID